jgi:membrane protease YdiL (CAAX protease family)
VSWLAILDADQTAPAQEAVSVAALVARILFGASLIVFSIGMLRLMLRALGLARSPVHAAQPTWGVREIAGLLALYIAVDVAAYLVFQPREGDLTQSLALSVLVSGILVAAAIAIASRRGSEGRAAFGLSLPGSAIAMIVGVCGYVLFAPCFIGSGLVWGSLMQLVGHQVQPQEVLTGFEGLEAGHRLIPILIGVVVIPFCEEALFRGFLQPVLVHWLRPWPGIAATAALFGLAHGIDAFFPIFALAMLLGWMKHVTQRLSASFAIHALHNGLTFYVAFHFPQIAGAGDRAGCFHLTP